MALVVVENLFKEFHDKHIRYCHWKSNEHLEAALNAETDLDILVDENQKEQAIEILLNQNFILFEAVWDRRYNGIVDFIGFDKKEAKIIHLHTHFKLAVGESGIKNYHLKWEEEILSTRVYNKVYNIYTTDPALEYLLLLARTGLKHKNISNRKTKRVEIDFLAENNWLNDQIQWENVREYSTKLFDDKINHLVKELWNTIGYDESLFKRLKYELKINLTKDKLISNYRVQFLKLNHFVKKATNKGLDVLGINLILSKRHLPNKGIIISLMGPDGAGKSTQVNLMTKELRKKVDVEYIYMGSGNGPKSWHRHIIDSFYNKIRRTSSKVTSNHLTPQGNKEDKRKSIFKEILISLRKLSLAIEKKYKLQRARRFRDKGKIVICDRYPQNIIKGYNDGPLMSYNMKSKNILLRKMANYENNLYNLSNKISPDIVVKLTGDVMLLIKRRPEMSIESITKKQEGIKLIQFGQNTKVYNIEVDQEVIDIKGEIGKIIFTNLANRENHS